ncbi:MAG TPA: type II toxin-antitoxin system HipA family toxin, partial [Chitinophagaceae bacterium]|nr:type II toxin-antitoxin system HipA family toxin [Chitinophagaceae bacterium]
NEYGKGLSLNITDADNSLDLNLAMEVAGYFRLSDDKASQIIEQVAAVVKDWRKVAADYKISNAEQERMSAAFV